MLDVCAMRTKSWDLTATAAATATAAVFAIRLTSTSLPAG